MGCLRGHHFEYRNGHYICRKCGYDNSKRGLRDTAIIFGIFAIIAIIGYVIYQSGIIQKETVNAVNIISTTKPTLEGISNLTSKISDKLYHDPMKDKPVIEVPTLEHKIHDLINVQREQNGLKPLLFDSQLDTIARAHSTDMATRNYFAHDTPEGISFLDRYKQAGYNCGIKYDETPNSYRISEGGENIFQNNLYNSIEYVNNYATKIDWNNMDRLASSTVSGWMASPGHRQNILTPQFQNEGIGVAIAGIKVYITEDFC